MLLSHSFIVISLFSLLGLVMVFVIIRSVIFRYPLTGKPSIRPFYFYLAKILFFLNWMLFLTKALFPGFGYIPVPTFLSWAGTALLFSGSILFIPGVLTLGSSLRYGIPEEETRLKTKGIFRISRNPLYAGLFIICIGSCLYFPDLLNVLFCVLTIVFHMRIIQAEETFLADRFGKEWGDYRQKVRKLI
jgi:protein-S-isoprenylcysteine O-methyltransferase Ste14